MNSPATAFAWEIWRRNRKRLIAIVGLLLGFALLYPTLCSLAGFDPHAEDCLDELIRKSDAIAGNHASPFWRVRLMYLGFLAAGPGIAMFLSILGLLWMFTFIEFNPNSKEAVVFPARVFTLPISTSFLFSWLFLSGVAAVDLLCEGWYHLVPLPRLGAFDPYQTTQNWLTLMALAQGIVWALAGWPLTRFLALSVVFAGFLGDQSWTAKFKSPLMMPALFLLGAALGRAGLEKMRHGQWQGWKWKWAAPALLAPAELRGPKRFASRAQAHLWFEWRRFARGLCFFVALLAVTPVVVHLVAYVVLGFRPLQQNTLAVFVLCLLALPLFIHFCHSFSPVRTDQPFLMLHPLTTGEMTMATLKAMALSTVVSWAVALAALAALPLLNRFRFVEFNVPIGLKAAIVIGLIVLTWRIAAVNLWSSRFAGLPFLALFAACTLPVLIALDQTDEFSRLVRWAILFIPTLLAILLAVKLLLAFFAFRECLRRRLLSRSEMAGYLAFWMLLVVSLFGIAKHLVPFPKDWMVPMALGIALVVPLARIALAPITLARARHA